MHVIEMLKYKYLKVKLGKSIGDGPQSTLGNRKDNLGKYEELQR
jgi:hypothetical protein